MVGINPLVDVNLPIIVNTDGVLLREGYTYLFKTGVMPISAIIAFASDPSKIGIVDIDGNAGFNNITLTTQQGNKFTYNNNVDTVLIVDVNNWSGSLIFDSLDFLWGTYAGG